MITNEGAKLLTTNPSIVNMKTLEHYDSYNCKYIKYYAIKREKRQKNFLFT